MVNEERRWAFLEENLAVTSPGWLPPAGECPELGALRAEHERLVAIGAELGRAAAEARRAFDVAEEARAAALAEGYLRGEEIAATETETITEAEVREARLRAEAARDALQTFARRAIEDASALAPSLHEGLDERVRAADRKRDEAARLLAEADRQVAETKRLRFWLRRVTGESVLGQYPFDEMPVPPTPAPLDLAAVLAGRSSSEVDVVQG